MFDLLKFENDVPDHTTISRRKATLGKVAFYETSQKAPVHILIDSSGLNVQVGQMRKPPKNRDWRKIHLAVDEQTGDVLACDLTSNSAHDSARVPALTWHTASGYIKRSKVETTFFRYKTIVGAAMRARGLAAQRVEATIGCKILNRMTALGRPDSQMIG